MKCFAAFVRNKTGNEVLQHGFNTRLKIDNIIILEEIPIRVLHKTKEYFDWEIKKEPILMEK